jgi:RTX calcium-binding nonapeptide repeat (4 copies)
MSRRRILIGALLGTAALATVPSAASASATCTSEQATRTMNVRHGATDTNLTMRNGATLRYSEGGGFLRSCFSTSGVPATAANTDKVVIKAASGTGAAAQTTTIDESFGGFPESNPNLQFLVFTGTGDRLIIDEGAGSDSVRLREQTEGLAIGPAVDLNYDGKIDLRMTTNDSVVQVNAGDGNDLVDATLASTYQTVQLGEGGNDVLVGGKKADSLNGGDNDDHLFAKDGVIDAVNGGSGIDKAQVDLNDQLTGVETPSS